MMNPEKFRKAADEALGGLVAGPALLNRARLQVQAGKKRTVSRRTPIFALASSLAVLVFILGALVLPRLNKPEIPVLDTLQAGENTLQAAGARMSADLPRGSLVLSRDKEPAYQGVWERGDNANFPLLRVGGRFYRLMKYPKEVSAILGSQLGSVQTFTAEPALDKENSLLSNVAALDAKVYAVSGMGQSAVVAAQVNGELRLFQRVSFAGTALTGSESLQDLLPHGVKALQLSGVGTITEPAAVQQLMDLLYQQASYQGSGSRSSKQALLLQYENGVVLQLNVKGDSLSACGTWACPGFQEAFLQAMK